MIAQLVLSGFLATIFLYAGTQYRRSPFVAVLSVAAALVGLYLVWVPNHATSLAEWVGVGRGADLVSYLWIVISFLLLINLHLKLRAQTDLITVLARKIALSQARMESDIAGPAPERAR